MENVKGILSSRLNGSRIFGKIREDLSAPVDAIGDDRNCPVHPAARAGYRVVPIDWTDGHDDYEASDFILPRGGLRVPEAAPGDSAGDSTGSASRPAFPIGICADRTSRYGSAG